MKFGREYVTIDEVYDAYYDCCKHKGSTPGCIEYQMNYIANNYQLYTELNSMTYEISKSKTFCVTRPKLREVFCAAFRDRIVHHLLAIKFADILESEMTDKAYACRVGKGTDYGIADVKKEIERVSENYTKEAWVLKCDLQGFFMSINRSLLYRLLEKVIREKYHGDDIEWWLWLWKKVVLHDSTKNCVRVGDLSLWDKLPANKSLFTCGEGIGLPIGNLPSQILANLLMSAFDKWVLSRIGESGGYGRYVDDFVVISRDKGLLLEILHDSRNYLFYKLQLTLHPDKVYLQEVKKGVKFTGAVIKPGRVYAGNATVQHLFDVIEKWNRTENPSKEQTEKFVIQVNSLFGHLVHRYSYGIRWRAWKEIKHKDKIYCVNMKKIVEFKNKKL